jgi:hypothetical protein
MSVGLRPMTFRNGDHLYVYCCSRTCVYADSRRGMTLDGKDIKEIEKAIAPVTFVGPARGVAEVGEICVAR